MRRQIAREGEKVNTREEERESDEREQNIAFVADSTTNED